MYLGGPGMLLTPPGYPEGQIQTVRLDEDMVCFFFFKKALDVFSPGVGEV